MNAQAHAAMILTRVIPGVRTQNPQSLTDAIVDEEQKPGFPVNQKALIRELCYGVCRWYLLLDYWANSLLSKPLKAKDQDVYFLLLVGIYQLYKLRIPDHAAISETVNASKALKKNWASKLVNAILRQCQRQQESLVSNPDLPSWIKHSHPHWLYQLLAETHPEQLSNILTANNSHPPMCLRVNVREVTPEAYLQQLKQAGLTAYARASLPQALYLEQACNVNELPGFEHGLVSVQDEAAQWAASLLDLKPGQRVLDACAAPGGKTAHILESCENLAEVVALDLHPQRAAKIASTLGRLKLDSAEKNVAIKIANAEHLEQWWDGVLFQRILLDAPCSATGVIRRHPDIKWLRQAADIKQLAHQQLALLQSVWQTLETNGILLYATCSVLPEENANLIARFLDQQRSAEELPIKLPLGTKTKCGWQLLPTENQHDGFFYALLRKKPV